MALDVPVLHPADVAGLAVALRFALGAFALVAVLQFIVLPTLVERFRHRLFTIRREMFLYMADGHISPSHPAYTQIRMAMNGALRFAERVTFVRLLLSAFAFRREAVGQLSEIDDALASIPDARVARQLQLHLDELALAVWAHLFRTSPLLWMCTAVLVVPLAVLLAIVGLKGFMRQARSLLGGLQAEVQIELLADT